MVKPVKLALTSPADSVSKVKRTVFATARLPPGGDAAFETAPIGDAYALRKLPAPIGVWISATATRCWTSSLATGASYGSDGVALVRPERSGRRTRCRFAV